MDKARIRWASIGLVALWILSNGANGWNYSPFRDDWEFLGRVASWPYGTRSQYYIAHQLLAYRPLSFLIDVQAWSRLWPHITIAWALLLTTMLIVVLAARSLASSQTNQSFWFASIVWLLWPGVVEGQAWVVGATGIVPSLLFLLVGFWLILKGIAAKTGRWIWASGAGIAFLISDLCYEQSWFAAFVIVAVIAWRYKRQSPLVLIPPFVALGVTGIWYASHQSGLGHNGKTPILSLNQLNQVLHLVGPQLAIIWGSQQFNAWREAFSLTLQSWGWWLAVILCIVAILFGSFPKRTLHDTTTMGFGLVGVGILWWTASYLPWLFTRYGWVADRSITISGLGLGLVIEGVWILMRKYAGHWGQWTGVSLMAVILIGSANLRANDIKAYAMSGKLDLQLAKVTRRVLLDHHIDGGTIVSWTPASTWVPWDYYGQDHISSTWSAPWGIQLMLEDLSKGREHFTVLSAPLPIKESPGVGLVITSHAPKASDLAQAQTSRGLVLEVALSGHTPRLIGWQWFNHA